MIVGSLQTVFCKYKSALNNVEQILRYVIPSTEPGQHALVIIGHWPSGCNDAEYGVFCVSELGSEYFINRWKSNLTELYLFYKQHEFPRCFGWKLLQNIIQDLHYI